MSLLLAASPTELKPPLKWAGGKRWLVPHLMRAWQGHAHRRLVEPLCGGLAVTLGLMPERALLNDVNPHAINFYQWLQRGFQIEDEMHNDERFYYSRRDRFNELVTTGGADTQESASIFYYLNRTGYNGLCRFNRQGGFNVPFGSYKMINYTRDFREYAAPLSAWVFRCGDFQGLDLDDEDFVYADPPYDVEFTQYSKEGFGWEDQVRLAEWLAAHNGPVVLSNQATPRIRKLYRRLGFRVKLLQAPRMINCTGDRSPALEVLATRGV